jgi:HlyD family secretion protein
VKRIIAAIIAVLIVGGGITYYIKNRSSGPEYKTVQISRGPIRSSINATGTVNAVTTVLVGTQVSGTLSKLNVDFNSRVRKGQVIAEIDPATLQAQADQARANVLVARANIQKARATLVDSGRIRDRNRQLFSRNLIARSDLDTSETNYDANEAQVAASSAQAAQAEAALRFAETNLRYAKIISPVDGIVVSRSVDVGQTVAASFQTPTLFTIAQDLTKMQIDTSVDEADIGKIEKGQSVDFTVDAYPDNTFLGRVEEIRIAPTTIQNVVTYDVVVKVNNDDLKLKPGMTANVTIIVAAKEDVLKVPNAALRFKPPSKDGSPPLRPEPSRNATSGPPGMAPGDSRGSARMGMRGPGSDSTSGPNRSGVSKTYAVWVLAEGKPKRVPLTIGISDGAFTEIVTGDLKEQQEVITESLSKKTQKPTNGGGPQSAPRFMR